MITNAMIMCVMINMLNHQQCSLEMNTLREPVSYGTILVTILEREREGGKKYMKIVTNTAQEHDSYRPRISCVDFFNHPGV